MRCARAVWPGPLADASEQLRAEYNRRLAIAIEAEIGQANAQNRLVNLEAVRDRVLEELGLNDTDELLL